MARIIFRYMRGHTSGKDQEAEEDTLHRVWGNPCVGGTFDILHEGHERLLCRACEKAEGRMLLVGVTSDELASTTREREVRPFEERAEVVSSFLEKKRCHFMIVELNNPYGPAANDPEITSIIVSLDTYGDVERINELRDEMDLEPLKIITVDMVCGEDGVVVSATRILGGEGKRGKAGRFGIERWRTCEDPWISEEFRAEVIRFEDSPTPGAVLVCSVNCFLTS